MMTWKPEKLYWKPEKNIQKQAMQIGRVTEVLMEKLLKLFPTLLLEISASRYEFGCEASPDAVIGKGPMLTQEIPHLSLHGLHHPRTPIHDPHLTPFDPHTLKKD